MSVLKNPPLVPVFHNQTNGNKQAIVEIPQFFIEEFIEFYPDAKFLLVERDVDAWERSINNSVKGAINLCKSFPMNILQYYDGYIGGFVGLHDAFEAIMFHGKGVEGGMEQAKRDSIAEYAFPTPDSPTNPKLYFSPEG